MASHYESYCSNIFISSTVIKMIYGKGAIRTPKEIRDTHYRLAATPPLLDWTQPYKVPTSTPVLFQDGSSACTAHAVATYCATLNEIENKKIEEYSRRFIYSQTSLGYNQGTYIWKAMNIPLKGLASEKSVPDGDSTEQIEMDKSLNAKAEIEARTDKYAVIPRSNIDQLAQVIKDYHGFVTGFNGHDGMFAQDGTIIDWSKSDWGHCVYLLGYEMRNGVKCLRFRNSWSTSWGSAGDGFIPEGFVNSGMMFDCYTYAAIADLDPNYMIITKESLALLYKAMLHRSNIENGQPNEFWIGHEVEEFMNEMMKQEEWKKLDILITDARQL